MKTELTQCPKCWASPSPLADMKPCELHRFDDKLAGPVGSTECDPDGSELVRCVKFSSDFMDGQHWCPIDVSDRAALIDTFLNWVNGAFNGEPATVEIITMSKREIERLPEI